MMRYDTTFKEEAVKMSDEVGIKKTAEQLGVPYYTISGWRKKRKQYGKLAHVGSGNSRIDPHHQREIELQRENAELRRANEILKDALGFFATDRKR